MRAGQDNPDGGFISVFVADCASPRKLYFRAINRTEASKDSEQKAAKGLGAISQVRKSAENRCLSGKGYALVRLGDLVNSQAPEHTSTKH